MQTGGSSPSVMVVMAMSIFRSKQAWEVMSNRRYGSPRAVSLVVAGWTWLSIGLVMGVGQAVDGGGQRSLPRIYALIGLVMVGIVEVVGFGQRAAQC